MPNPTARQYTMEPLKLQLRHLICDHVCPICGDGFCGREQEHKGPHMCVFKCGESKTAVDGGDQGEVGERDSNAAGSFAAAESGQYPKKVTLLTKPWSLVNTSTCVLSASVGLRSDKKHEKYEKYEEFYNAEDVMTAKAKRWWIKVRPDALVSEGALVRGKVMGTYNGTHYGRVCVVCKDNSLIVVRFNPEFGMHCRERWFRSPLIPSLEVVDNASGWRCEDCWENFTQKAACDICRRQRCDQCRENGVNGEPCCREQDLYHRIKVLVILMHSGTWAAEHYDKLIASIQLNRDPSYRHCFSEEFQCDGYECRNLTSNLRCLYCHGIRCDQCRQDQTGDQSCCHHSQQMQILWNEVEGEQK